MNVVILLAILLFFSNIIIKILIFFPVYILDLIQGKIGYGVLLIILGLLAWCFRD